MVEAAGIEPASRNARLASVYVHSPWFGSHPRSALGPALVGPAPLFSRRLTEVQSSSTSPLFTSPCGRRHSARKRLLDKTRQRENSCWQLSLFPGGFYGVTRGPRHATRKRDQTGRNQCAPFLVTQRVYPASQVPASRKVREPRESPPCVSADRRGTDCRRARSRRFRSRAARARCSPPDRVAARRRRCRSVRERRR